MQLHCHLEELLGAGVLRRRLVACRVDLIRLPEALLGNLVVGDVLL